MKSPLSFLRFVVPVLFVTLVGGFVVVNCGLFSCWQKPVKVVPTVNERVFTKKDSVLVYPDSKARDTIPNPFPDRALSPDPRMVFFSSSKSIGIIPFESSAFQQPASIMGDEKTTKN
jgi:hypothetical protein